jgi:ABC-type branched-subunit amino acid transport system ATPase component
MQALELQAVSASWLRHQPILGHSVDQPVWAEISSGERLGVIGENGVGKSSLLHAIAGSVPYVSGRILAHGRVLPPRDLRARFLTGVHLVEQQPALMYQPHFMDAVDLFRLKRSAFYNRTAVFDLIHEFRRVICSNMIDPRLIQLLASILAVPTVLLLDEVRPAWPEDVQNEFYQFIRALLPLTTIVFVDHDIHQVVKHSTKVLWLRSERQPSLFSVTDQSSTNDAIVAFRKDSNRLPETQESVRYLPDLKHRPDYELRLAARAANWNNSRIRIWEERLKEIFPFLFNTQAVEQLSGGQRIVLTILMNALAGSRVMPSQLLAHLDRDRINKLKTEILFIQGGGND